MTVVGAKQTRTEDSTKIYICGIIITYNPDPLVLSKVICAIADDLDKIFIIDNASDNSYEIRREVQQEFHNVELILNRKNFGFTAALNMGIAKCYEANANFVLIMTQDTILPENGVSRLVEFYFAHKKLNIGIVSVNQVVDRLAQSYSEEFSCVTIVATTGILIPMHVLSEIGIYRSNFFIYYEDIDLCRRMRQHGYKIIRLNFLRAKHKEGDARVISFLPRLRLETIPVRKPKMLYYLARNGIYVTLYEDQSFILVFLWVTFSNLVSSIAFYKKPLVSIKFTALGIVHGILKRLGMNLVISSN